MNELDDQITSAVGTHGLWKNRLRAAIASGTSDMAVDVARNDHQCNFGKWLHGTSLSAEAKKSNHFRTCAEMHRRFHIVASEILALAIAGKKNEASAALAPGHEFGNLSTALTNAMMSWKTSLSGLTPAVR